MKIYPVLFLLFTAAAIAQNLSVSGKVLSAKDNQFLFSANVFLLSASDSVLHGCKTDKSGFFSMGGIKPGSYTLTVNFLGYKSYSTNLLISKKKTNLGNIFLNEDIISTNEVVISENVQKVTQSGDTLIYNAKGFKVNDDAVAEDLLTKIPGIQMENGTLKAQGEEVKKVYVDGKSFFGDDPNAAIKNLPANIIDRIQIFDKQSDQSEFTGFDDGSTSKAINIITEINIQNGSFGKLSAGYGTDEKYNASGNLNFFNDVRRISLVSQLNNTNEQNYSGIDLLGAMPGSRGEPSGPPSGDNAPKFFNASSEGETTTKAFGLNYNDEIKNTLKSGVSYFFNNTSNNLNSVTDRIFTHSVNNEKSYFEKSTSLTGNTNHRLNIQLNLDIDSLNTIRFIPGFSFQKIKSNSNSTAVSDFYDGSLNRSENSTVSDMKGLNLNSLLMYNHKFNNKGRSVSLTFNSSLKNSAGTNNLFSETQYAGFSNLSINNQQSNIDNTGSNITAGITYTEPMDRYNFLMFNTSYSVSNDKNDKKTFNFDYENNRYSRQDTLLSSIFNKEYTTIGGGAGYRFKKGSFTLNANLNYNMSELNSEHEYPAKYIVNRKFFSLLPSAMLKLSTSSGNNIELFYRSFTSTPSVTQLQNVINNSNPLQLTIGNASLKQETGHFAAVHYSYVNYSNMHSIFLMAGGFIKQNYIGSRTISGTDSLIMPGVLLKRGSKLIIPENLSGYMNINSFITYGLPVELISSNLNLDASLSYSRTPAVLDEIKNITNTFTYGFGLTVSSNISTEVDFELSTRSKFNNIRGTNTEYRTENYFSQNSFLKFYALLFNRVVFRTRFTHNYTGELSSGNKPNTFVLNADIGVKLFPDNSGELRFSVNDMLNQNTNITKTAVDNYTEEYSTNTTGRYYLLSFNYNLRVFNL